MFRCFVLCYKYLLTHELVNYCRERLLRGQIIHTSWDDIWWWWTIHMLLTCLCLSYPLWIFCLLFISLHSQALLVANQKGQQLIPLYCFDPRHYEGTHHYKFPKTGSHRLGFLLDSLADLKGRLQSHGRYEWILGLYSVKKCNWLRL